MTRAISVIELLSKKRKIMEFEGKWKASFGCPEVFGTILIWGGSGNGKTRFTLQLCKYLTKFGRVVYNSLEEADGETMAKAFREVGMMDVAKKVTLLPAESLENLKIRLKRHKSPSVIVIDSVQYTGMSYADYRTLKDEFRNKLFIFISHAEGKAPDGKVAKKIKYDANVKVRIEGYMAFVTSRYGGGEPFTIWEEGANKYWGLEDNNDQ